MADGGIYNAEQTNCVNKTIYYLIDNYALAVAHIFAPPFSDDYSAGANEFFDEGKLVELFERIQEVNANADVKDSNVGKVA